MPFEIVEMAGEQRSHILVHALLMERRRDLEPGQDPIGQGADEEIARMPSVRGVPHSIATIPQNFELDKSRYVRYT